MNDTINDLVKALEAGSYNAAPSTLTQGSALQMEDLSPVMEVVTFEDKAIKLQKVISKKSAKATLVQFNRQLSYGTFGASAQLEGGIGEEQVSDYVRAVVPMAYYSTVRRVSVAANMIGAFDGQKAEDREAKDAALLLAGDIEFDLFRGQDDFSTNGVFDGNPLSIAHVPNMVGVGAQIRMSDSLANTQDLMFAEYGSDMSVVLSVNGVLSQSSIEDGAVKTAMNHGDADKLYLDPISLSQYNKIAHAKERIVLAGAPQESTGANLRTQWTSNGSVISLESSRFLAGKTRPARATLGSASAPVITSAAAADAASVIESGTYVYAVSAVNERGESNLSAAASQIVADGEKVTITIANVQSAKYYNVYRSESGGSVASAKFIGKVKATGAISTIFTDLGHKAPGSVTGYLLQSNTMGVHELAPYTRMKMAVNNLSIPEAHFRFLCLAVPQPRKNVLFDNITGQL